MGEVFRARDPRLDRDVAIKILAPSLARDPDALARFEREAMSVARLSHPNILAIHEFGRDGDTVFVAMELVDGETLRARLAGGPLASRRAIAYAHQIARGIAAAHGRGIIHRDLKPENVMIGRDDQIKILDFGLAKPIEQGPVDETRALSMKTGAGTILGTFAYMAPEQVRGLPVDHRADIFAFGAVLYEMLSGERAFKGETAADTMTAILTKDPPELDASRLAISPALDRIVRRCLEKSPDLRFQSATDLAFALETLSTSSGASSVSAAHQLPAASASASNSVASAFRRNIPWLVAALATLVAIAALAGFPTRRGGSGADAPVRKWIVPQDAGDQDIWSRENLPALSPDGARLAYVDGAKLRIRDLASLTSREVTVRALPALPVWSPDGAHLAFVDGTVALWRAPAAGGAPTKIADLPASVILGIAWRPDHTIFVNVAYGPRAGEIVKVSETGGRPEKWTVPGLAEGEQPFFLRGLPDGSLTFGIRSVANPDLGWALQRGSEPLKRLEVPSNSSLTYASSGHLLFTRRDGTAGIFAVPFDLVKGAVTGEPFRVAEAGIGPSASADGTLAYGLPNPGQRQMVWVERDGDVKATVGQPQESMWAPAISPDGARIAVTGVENGRPGIWVHEVARAVTSRLTFGDVSVDPAWHPKDGRIAFQTAEWNINTVPADGGEQNTLLGHASPEYSPDWSRDGRHLVFCRFSAEGQSDIWMLEAGAAEPKPVFASTFGEDSPVLSPDGRYLAYVSNETGRREVVIRPFPTGGPKTQVSFAGGTSPRWNPRGGEIFFVESKTLMAAAVRTSPSLAVESPKRLFTLEDRDAALRQYDTADGERFVVVRTIRPARNGVVVVQNWLKEFAR